MRTFDDAFADAPLSTAAAFECFDALETADESFMIGHWRGASIPTGHPMDGVLEAYGWHGKRFDNAETVHPLVFTGADGRRRCIDPLRLWPLVGWIERHGLPATGVLPRVFMSLLPLLSTRRPRARLRLGRWRGRDSAIMVYDHLPIIDVFRRIDDRRALGVMDMRAMRRPFFFLLHRDSTD